MAVKNKPARTAGARLDPDFVAKITGSGLTIEFATKTCKMSFVQNAQSVGDFKPVRALRIPYLDPIGKQTGFFRLRYLEQPPSLLTQTNAKQMRYVQPKDSMSEVYFTPGRKWIPVLADPAVPIWITEGEFKGAAACERAGVNCLALGGVFNFKSTKAGHRFLPALRDIKWGGRTVYVCFDSDSVLNPMVQLAQHQLCDELTSLGAHPWTVRLPDVLPNGKTGLDDYLVARKDTGLEYLIEHHAQPYSPAKALWELNRRVAYVRNPGFIVDLSDGRYNKMSARDFQDLAYANVHYTVKEINAKGDEKLVKKPIAPAWLKWEHRTELRALTFKPGQPEITVDGELNAWRPSGLTPGRGDTQLWEQLMRYIFPRKEDRASRVWFEQWCAYPLQNPGSKLATAVVMWSVKQGTGKSMIGQTLMRLYGAHNCSEISQEHLHSPYNDWAENKQFVMGDEISGSDRRADADRLKNMVTQKQLRINMKYVKEFSIPDCVNYYFTSNHPDAFFLEDTDRRFFIWEVTDPPLADKFYTAFYDWLGLDPLKRDEASATNAGHLLQYFLTLSMDGFNPAAAAPVTAAKEDMILDNKSELGAWVRQLRTDPDRVLRLGDIELEGDLWSNEQLLSIFDPGKRTRVSANAMGRELKRAGFTRMGVVRTKTQGLQRLYAVRNGTAWLKESAVACAAHFDVTCGKHNGQKADKY